jgi:Holliday junction resolvase
MQRVSILNRDTALRAKELGVLGERMAIEYLREAGFSDISNLNDIKNNYPYADIVATRDGLTYAISVKTRNKYEARSGNLNVRYKLGKKCEQMAAFAAKYQNATPAWLAIQVDGELASVFFGTLADLMGNKGIPMTPDATEQYECLASNEPHGWDLAHLKNTYELRCIQPTKPSTATE